MRPCNDREKQYNDSNSITIDSLSNQISITPGRQYKFDYIADHFMDQESVYLNSAFSIVDSCLKGINGTIFAYG